MATVLPKYNLICLKNLVKLILRNFFMKWKEYGKLMFLFTFKILEVFLLHLFDFVTVMQISYGILIRFYCALIESVTSSVGL